ncbi:MAG: MgtC/SapB family protein [Gemmatimonadota bacterium]
MAEFLANLDLSVLHLDLLGRLLLAAALGGVVGLEREWSGKPAGFRTNLLICVGAALLTELSVSVAVAAEPDMQADPARIAAQIVSGIGFLGAGTIIQSRGSVVGLTTAATLWVVAAVGMAVGLHAYTEAVGTTILVVIALLLLGRLEPLLSRHAQYTVRITMGRDPAVRDRVEASLGQMGSHQVLEMEHRDDRVLVTYHVTGLRRRLGGLVTRLVAIEGVDRVNRG